MLARRVNGVPLIPLLFFAVAGVVALVLGLRGRRIDDHPICRKCRFDLVGVWPGGERCPECGAQLPPEPPSGRRARAVRFGRRRRFPRFIVAGACFTLAGLLPLLFIAAIFLAGPSADAYKPTWLLAIEATYSAPERESKILARLLAAAENGKLPVSDVRALASRALRLQADRSRPWNPGWGDLFATAWDTGQVTPDEAIRFVRNGVKIDLQIRARARVDTGPIFRLVAARDRLGVGRGPQVELVIRRTRLGAHESATVGSSFFQAVQGTRALFESSLPAPSKIGPADWSVAWTIRIKSDSGVPLRSLLRATRDSEYIDVFSGEQSGTVQVVGRGEPIIPTTADPALAEQIRRAFDVESLSLYLPFTSAGDDGSVLFDVGFKHPDQPAPAVDIDLCMAWRDPDGRARETRLGAVSGDPAFGITWDPQGINAKNLPAIGATNVDLVLRANPARAELNLDADRAWAGADVVIAGVPLRDERSDAHQRERREKLIRRWGER